MNKKSHTLKPHTTGQVPGGAGATATSGIEKQLDDAIYRCLHALTKRHEPSDDFRAQFCRRAFLKQNTKAFIQVIHFLFNVYDAAEFRKRFYWPIYDKGAENAFRTSTVDYVNQLIDCGKLVGMEKIKAHVVVLPGGVKFMKFLLGLIRFVLQEELRKIRPTAPGAPKMLTKANMASMIASNGRWIDIQERLFTAVQEETNILSSRIRKNNALLKNILQKSDLAQRVTYEELMVSWDVVITRERESHEQKRAKVQSIAQEFQDIIQQAWYFLKEHEKDLSFSKDQLKEVQTKLQERRPPLEFLAREMFDKHEKLNPLKLIEFYSALLPAVVNFFESFCPKNESIVKFEHKELSRATAKLTEIRQEMDYLSRTLPLLKEQSGFDCDPRSAVVAHDSSPESVVDNFAIKNKLFSTPPIVMDFEGQNGDAPLAGSGRCSARIAFLNKDEVHTMNARLKLLSTSIYQPRTLRAATANSVTSASTETDMASTNVFAVPRVARKEKLNPLTMLDRIKAQSQSQRETSRPANNSMNISALSEMSLHPEFSSTLLATPEKMHKPSSAEHFVPSNVPMGIQGHNFCQSSPTMSSPRLLAIYAGTATPKSALSPRLLVPGISAGVNRCSSTIKKRSSLLEQEAVQTSPSGRLDSIVRQGEINAAGVRIVLNEIVDLTVDNSDTEEDNTLSPENGGQLMDFSRTLLANTALERTQYEKLHSQNTLLSVMESEEENLFNVSDGIVTDIE
ncbi:augmin complex subunit dgt6 [Anopheles bellator]|uniref:augmin complex subunit dgt6 n=1 Tax=Anopheles bellator TaxID=139047 RepID=UPI0026499BC2|nr:augmin complex subunit dgt6 [Anopheles bellator]